MTELTVRPSPAANGKVNHFLTAYLSPTYLVRYNLREHGVHRFQKSGRSAGYCILAKADSTIKLDVIQLSTFLQQACELKLGDKIALDHAPTVLPSATNVQVRRTDAADEHANGLLLESEKQEEDLWLRLIREAVIELGPIAPGLILTGISLGKRRRTYEILEINSTRDFGIYNLSNKCHFHCASASDGHASERIPQPKPFAAECARIAGLRRQLDQIDEVLREYHPAQLMPNCDHGKLPRERGILLHGAAGTGKSMILQAFAESRWKQIFSIHKISYHGLGIESARSIIREVFESARRQAPSAILMDDLDVLVPKRDGGLSPLANILTDEIDRLDRSPVFLVGAAQRLSDVETSLRRLDRFSLEIEIPVPFSSARHEILTALTGTQELNDPIIARIADRTHGFVGRDLESLRRIAGKRRRKRLLQECEVDAVKPSSFKIEEEDFLWALKQIRPTAIREIYIETPNVSWSDIAGQQEVKEHLEEVVVWPFKYPQEMERLAIRPSSGLLLYGPPGCSKTMTAKAVAAESGLNFIAVKGAQLLNMYVGETERAIRDLFAKARAASPSILFFDEIDAIAGSRGSNQHGGVQTVTTLLNELDGVDDARGVFILAATNRPEVLDPALTRPGRLDDMIYVGPPDKAARRSILESMSRKMDLANREMDFGSIAESSARCSGAEMVWICQRAGRLALREQIQCGHRKQVEDRHFQQALAQVARNITPEMETAYEAFAANRRS